LAVDFEAVKKEAREYADDVRRTLSIDSAYLFGSYAKGTATEWSDVDVCFFVTDYNGKSRVDIIFELLKLCRRRKVPFEPLAFEAAELERDNPFVNEVLRTGIEI
jgi:predicted nucleotidyltransferase